jgi:hypothetical protein
MLFLLLYCIPSILLSFPNSYRVPLGLTLDVTAIHPPTQHGTVLHSTPSASSPVMLLLVALAPKNC